MSEFSIIDEFFKPLENFGSLAELDSKDIGIGDDGAVISCPKNKQLVVVTDTLVEGVHFPIGTPAYDIAWKALAVNLSDLAAMGAELGFYTLCLSLPKPYANKVFLSDFSAGLKALSETFNIPLVGGDMTRSDRLTVTITAQGWAAPDKVLRRNGAKLGDKLYVSGKIGDGAVALQAVLENYDRNALETSVWDKFFRPEPRVALGSMLGNVANAAIDISDGLAADLSHLLSASGFSAEVDFSKTPFSSSVESYMRSTKDYWLPITGGDDYELCFSIPKDKVSELEAILALRGDEVEVTCIGEVVELQEQRILWQNLPEEAKCSNPMRKGYEHF